MEFILALRNMQPCGKGCRLHWCDAGIGANWKQLQLPEKQSGGIWQRRQTAAAQIPGCQKPRCGAWQRHRRIGIAELHLMKKTPRSSSCANSTTAIFWSSLKVGAAGSFSHAETIAIHVESTNGGGCVSRSGLKQTRFAAQTIENSRLYHWTTVGMAVAGWRDT